ncbi:hypothetical protein [Noviherbaspirillum autotrophicum]|uniref:hypothetical protein n=1 Tax=Noviherbaspirillum autotrophicum TaxID=709839 RepID=UPI000B1831CB|nr:hypothetical protein [Noviherbaspirillum autotrophicum]
MAASVDFMPLRAALLRHSIALFVRLSPSSAAPNSGFQLCEFGSISNNSAQILINALL